MFGDSCRRTYAMAESQTINNMKLPTIGEGRTAAGTTNQRKGKSRKMRSDRIPEKRQYRVKTNPLLQLNFTSQGADNDETGDIYIPSSKFFCFWGKRHQYG